MVFLQMEANCSVFGVRLPYVCLIHVCDKAKPAKRRGRKVTGPRFFRDAFNIATEDPTTAELPKQAEH